ncbi:MAG: hypothetical protein R6V04_13570 [bacterium]
MRLVRVHILFILMCGCLPVLSQDSINREFQQNYTFQGDGKRNFFVLPHHFIIPGTLYFSPDSMNFLKDCKIDYTRGTILFRTAPDSARMFTVHYEYIPLNIKLSYQHWKSTDSLSSKVSKPEEESITLKAADRTNEFSSENLQKSGSIFRGISIGTNQGMRLESGLRLQLSGKILPSVDVVASLTDQNLPIQPEGNTQKLQEIDKVFINIKTSGFSTTMGDIMFESGVSNFSSYTRKLKGVMGKVETNYGSLRFMAAATKGEYTTNHFIGEEGNQGPYQLTGNNGELDIIVLAGTEKVWINGESKVRGEENDYTIEYGNGQITFTRHCLITEHSRITVDFEYSSQKYQKEIYGTVGHVDLLDKHIGLDISFISEVDDKSNPLDIILTDTYKQVLKEAGDSPDSAMASGAEYVGEEKGSYVKIDSAGYSFYLYAGPESGDYQVRFSYVGQGKGDYSLQGYGIYRYEGPGKGAYLPVVLLPRAQSHQMTDVAFDIGLSKGISLGGELGISSQDLNLFSSVDDGDNLGFAKSGNIKINKDNITIGGKSIGGVEIQGMVHSIGDNFRPVGRIAEVEHGRRWGVSEGEYWGEDISQITGIYKPWSDFTIKAEAGSFRRNTFSSDRKSLFTEFKKKKYPNFDYYAELIKTESNDSLSGFWLRQNGELNGELWWFRPFVKYMGEHRQSTLKDSLYSGFRFNEWQGGVFIENKSIHCNISRTFRDDDKYQDYSLQQYSVSSTDRIKLGVRLSRDFSSEIMYTHHNRTYEDPAVEDKITDLADLKMKFSPWQRAIDGIFFYKFSSTQISEMVRDTVNLGRGLGMYRYDKELDELVPDTDGNIILRNIQTGTFLPINEVRIGGNIRLNGDRIFKDNRGLKKFVDCLKTRTTLRVERKEKDKDFMEVNKTVFSPQWGQDSSTVLGRLTFFQDLEYNNTGNGLYVRFRYKNNISDNNQLLQQDVLRRGNEKSLRIKGNPVNKMAVMLEYKDRKEIKHYDSKTRMDRNINAYDWWLDVSYRPKQKIELKLKTQYVTAENSASDPRVSATSLFFMPSLRYAILGKGHIKTEVEIGKVTTEPESSVLPYEMISGNQPGNTLRWSVFFTYRISGHVMATLNYRGRNEPWRDRIYQTGKVEVRVFF